MNTFIKIESNLFFMSKIVYIHSKKALDKSISDKLKKICLELVPDNIEPIEPKISKDKNSAYAIMNPTKAKLEKKNSVLLGVLYGDYPEWHKPGSEFPDGSFSLSSGIKIA